MSIHLKFRNEIRRFAVDAQDGRSRQSMANNSAFNRFRFWQSASQFVDNLVCSETLRVPAWFGASAQRAPTLSSRQLIVHAGLHKTGTTSIQAALATRFGQSSHQAMLYPTAGQHGVGAGHHNIAWQLSGDSRFERSFGTLDDAAREIAAFPGDAIVSSEDFENVLATPERLRPLVEHDGLLDREVIILIYVRDQVTYAESLFAQMQRHGIDCDVASFCDEILTSGELRFMSWRFQFDYGGLHTRLRCADLARLVMRPYAGLVGGSSVADILHVTGQALTPQAASSGIANPDQRLNCRDGLVQSLAKFCCHRLGRDLRSTQARLEALLGAHCGGRRAQLPPGRRAQFRQRFADGNKRVALACGFAYSALDWADVPPPGGFDMETLFSSRTLHIAGEWLDGRSSDRQTVANLLTARVAGRA